MNRKEAAELLPIIKAFAEGKNIEYRTKGFNENWKKVTQIPELSFKSFEYRIKPEPSYRPFANAEECWNEMKKHQPFGWLKTIGVRTHFAECKSIGELVMIGLENTPHIYEHAFHTYTFADGTPFGVKVEE